MLTDEEAYDEVEKYVEEDLWAFRSSFIISHMTYQPQDLTEREQIEQATERLQNDLCESANILIKSLIKDIKRFIDDAISEDGRGHFLSPYDGKEIEFIYKNTEYYIYRQN